MRRTLLIGVCLTLIPLCGSAADGDSFVAGAGAPEEMFGPTQGPLLFGAAGALLIAVFVLLLFSIRIHRRLGVSLDHIEALIFSEDHRK